MTFDAIIVAGGGGSRAGEPKQWRLLNGRPVAWWSVRACLDADARTAVLVAPEPEIERAEAVVAGLTHVRVVAGGATRAASVRNGLAALPPGAGAVVIHDAARPLLQPRHLRAALDGLDEADGAILALPVTDTLKRGERHIEATAPRDGLWRAQTPQAFRREALERAEAAWPGPDAPTDEAALLEAAGMKVALVPGDPRLHKITYPEDFAMIEALASVSRRTAVGQGYDVHRLVEGDGVWLCGVRIAHNRALLGHSDADAGLHALTDALLGALGEGDIGDHFPPSDPQWKGAASDIFLHHAVGLMKARGGRLDSADVTLICEQPKIKPHRQAMRERLAQLLETDLAHVSVKATTTEGLGFTGREEGVAAQAVVSVSLPG